MEPKVNKEFIKFEFPWTPTNDDFRQLTESSKNISRRFWTTHNNTVLEWRAEFSLDNRSKSVHFGLTYVDGPSASAIIQLKECSMVRVLSDGTYYEKFLTNGYVGDEIRNLTAFRGDTDTVLFSRYINPNYAAQRVYQVCMKVAASSFHSIDIPRRPATHDWVLLFGDKYHENIENSNSKHHDVRLVSGDNHAFYCHRLVLVSQSEAMAAMFRNATTEEEKSGTFRLSAWSTEELRKILAYLYGVQFDLESSSIDQLMHIYDFAEQHNLEALKSIVYEQLWKRALEKPSDCTQIARFADLHSANGLNPLKYRCFEILAKNYARMGWKVDDIFEEKKQQQDNDGEPPAKKARGSGDVDAEEKKDEVGIRLKNELFEYMGGRIEGVLILEGKE